ncbi:rhodanese-like domain-containing protein [Parasporobacterium paucivorans]|uniref:Rhodanese-related sulfurtransferase n=1 Tax=Parasporobacterium paucivorans DSM 15970 TaxID=1122934 RepID=A0A1M6EP59_9FIRM|nr:rhodanese-like domain-containing protein [Parasporobacterium paucivorans]SHI87128.1 Rhodanese-related sulfurtransferase [Parasporobacterium paucivorans DSM 15970]
MFDFLKKSDTEVIHVNDIDGLIGKIELIDIREPGELRGGTILTAKNIPMGQLQNNPGKYLLKDKTYYIMCQSGARSARTVRALSKEGYKVINVAGGFGSYVGTKRK